MDVAIQPTYQYRRPWLTWPYLASAIGTGLFVALINGFELIWTLLGALLAAGSILLGIFKPPFIEARSDGISFRDQWPWSSAEHIPFEQIKCFEYRVFFRGRNSKLWAIAAIVEIDGRESIRYLPAIGRKPFGPLKKALAAWQTERGCLQPLRYADASDDVQI